MFIYFISCIKTIYIFSILKFQEAEYEFMFPKIGIPLLHYVVSIVEIPREILVNLVNCPGRIMIITNRIYFFKFNLRLFI